MIIAGNKEDIKPQKVIQKVKIDDKILKRINKENLRQEVRYSNEKEKLEKSKN